MNLDLYLNPPEDEKPLDNIVTDGGLCAIFRTIAVIGDSLASGEFQTMALDGTSRFHDYYEYSWGQYIARDCGSTVYNFSIGGMSADHYWESFGDDRNLWDPQKAAQAYIIALGCNDLVNQKQELGTVADIHPEDWNQNEKTYAGYIGRIISRYKSIQPKARFFLVTMPRQGDDHDPLRAQQARLMHDIAKVFDYTYVIDLNRYDHVYDQAFRDKYYLFGHQSPAGYILSARIIESYIDYIIRHDPDQFKQVGLIGTAYYQTDHPELP